METSVDINNRQTRIEMASQGFDFAIMNRNYIVARRMFAEASPYIVKNLEDGKESRSALWMINHLFYEGGIDNESFCVNFVVDNAEAILNRTSQDLNALGEGYLAFNILSKTLAKLRVYGDKDENYKKILNLLEAKVPELEKAVLKGFPVAKPLAKTLFRLRQRDSDKKADDYDDVLFKFLFDEGIPIRLRETFFDELQGNDNKLVSELFERALDLYFGDKMVQKDIVDSFQESETRGLRTPLLSRGEVYKTLEICKEIEDKIPGGCKRINKTFGITHFARYSSGLLIEQLKDWGNEDNSPYGVYIGSWDDWNNAIRGGETVLSISTGVKKLGIKFRMVEARNEEEFVIRQIALRDKFKNADKFHFLIINAHGQPSGFDLGRGSLGSVSIANIPLLKKDVASLYVHNMQTLFFSCSTGVEKGFAESWADSRIESVGPDRDASVKTVNVFSRPGGLVGFRVEYNEGAIQKRYPRLAESQPLTY